MAYTTKKIVTSAPSTVEEAKARIQAVKEYYASGMLRSYSALRIQHYRITPTQANYRETMGMILMIMLAGGKYELHLESNTLWHDLQFVDFGGVWDIDSPFFRVQELMWYDSKDQFDDIAEKFLKGLEELVEHEKRSTEPRYGPVTGAAAVHPRDKVKAEVKALDDALKAKGTFPCSTIESKKSNDERIMACGTSNTHLLDAPPRTPIPNYTAATALLSGVRIGNGKGKGKQAAPLELLDPEVERMIEERN